jgi:DHA2 family multidrug resistance protein-like MFS transporter
MSFATEDTETLRQEQPPPAGRREWIGLAVLALPCLLYSMDLTVLHLAVPKLTADLHPSSAQLLWIIDIYGFLVAGSLITMGTLGDRIGRRRLLLIGAAAFGVASVAAAFATSAAMLIATRALLGLAGATIAPGTLSLIRTLFEDPRQRTTAIGVWVTSFSIGGAIGPLVGGVLLEMFWWGSVFLLAVPVMVLLLIVGPRLLPEYRDPGGAGRLDLFSALLSLTAVLAMIYGLKQIAQDGVGARPVLFIVAGVAIGLAFVRRQLRLPDPLLDLRLFRVRAFSASLATYGLSILFLFGGFLFLPQYLQLIIGLSPFRSGLWTIPYAIAFVVGSMVTPIIVRRIRPATLMACGLAIGSLGFVLFTRIDESTGFVMFALGSTIFSLFLSPVFTLTTDVIVGSAPPERAGAASAISETSAAFGGALGIAVFGSIGVAIYRGMIGDALPPGIPPDAAEAAKSTLAGALDVARELPDAAGAALASAAKTAFIKGLHVCAAIGAIGALALSVWVALTLRHARSGSSAA